MKKYFTLAVILIAFAIQLNGQIASIAEVKSDIQTLPPDPQKPLVIVMADNKKMQTYDSFGLGQINPDWIQSIKIIKGEDATNRYGSLGRNGIVLMYLKNGTYFNMPESLKSLFQDVYVARENSSQVLSDATKPLIVIMVEDKKIQTFESSILKDYINPDWIQSADVIKGEDAISKYGSLGRNGVAVIRLKVAAFSEMSETLKKMFQAD